MDASIEKELIDQGRQGEAQAHSKMGLRIVGQIGNPNRRSHVLYLRGVGRNLDINPIQEQIILSKFLSPLLVPMGLSRLKGSSCALPLVSRDFRRDRLVVSNRIYIATQVGARPHLEVELRRRPQIISVKPRENLIF